MIRRTNLRRAAPVSLAACALVAVGLAGPATAGEDPDQGPRNDRDYRMDLTRELRQAVKVKHMQRHLRALQAIGDANNGTRQAGTPGFTASVDYIVGKAKAAGLNVTTQNFTFRFNTDNVPPVLTAKGTSYVDGVDFASMTYSANGDVTAPVVAVDTVDAVNSPPSTSNSGCEAADFAGFPAGAIALVQRGTCTFALKAQNAQAAGAVGVVVYNEGQPGRTAVVGGTLGAPDLVTIPVVGATYALGADWLGSVRSGPTGVTARLKVDRSDEDRTSTNVIGETPTGDPTQVIVVGAHLDSVSRGPGINDNGSGSAGILAIAEAMQKKKIEPRNQVRFVWWGAEEFGLLGSQHYVRTLTPAQVDDIALNLNFDMIASPNYVRFVYDGDNSAFPVGPGAAAGPQGSGLIEQVFHEYFQSKDLASAETPFSGRSDYGPFIGVGIPAGGLFTGAEGAKTPAEEVLYGGTAGVAYDACYHLACDTIANINEDALDEMSDGAAHATMVFAMQDFAKFPLVNPATPVRGTNGGGGGGGLHDHEHEAEAS